MLLKVIAKYKDGKPSNLTLYKERTTVKNGEVFEISDEERANEILNATFQGNPIAELIDEKQNAQIQSSENLNAQANNNDAKNDESNNAETLNDLTVKALQELAAAEGIELTATKKVDIIAEIELARAEKETNSDNKENSDEDDSEENKKDDQE